MPIYERHPFLYHYTTFEGLCGIWKTKTLHATRFSSLNDREETKSLKLILRNVLNCKESEDTDFIYGSVFGDGKVNSFFNPYIVSFCSHSGESHKYEQNNGLLSQWRGYGKEVGCAIVFDTCKLHKLVCEERDKNFDCPRNVFFEDVYYTMEDFFRKFETLAHAAQDIIPRLRQGEPPEMDEAYRVLTRAMCLLKHEGFKEESEVRIVLSPKISRDIHRSESNKTKQEYFKPNFKPYIELFDSLEMDHLPIAKIIVGPAHDNSFWRDRIDYMVRDANIEVTCSQTPLIRI